ncbi:MAG: hypothetical protein HYZ89_03755 [Candidatus Omnitrophica bacterium]|nr:hypothetical protein [Candidatus Omnitrophota bacterium]
MRKRPLSKRIGEILAERGVLTREQVDEALAHQRAHGGRVGQILIERRIVDDRKMVEECVVIALAIQYGFPSLPLDRVEIDRELVLLIPETLARRHAIVPIDRIGRSLTLAMADPLDARAIEEAQAATGCAIHPVISPRGEILAVIERLYPH